MRLAFWITFAVAILAALFVLVASGLPLGVPGEWEWGRTAVPEPLWMTIVPLAGAGLLYLGFVALGSGRVERCRALGLSGWLGGLVVAGFAWLWMAQEKPGSSAREGKRQYARRAGVSNPGYRGER